MWFGVEYVDRLAPVIPSEQSSKDFKETAEILILMRTGGDERDNRKERAVQSTGQQQTGPGDNTRSGHQESKPVPALGVFVLRHKSPDREPGGSVGGDVGQSGNWPSPMWELVYNAAVAQTRDVYPLGFNCPTFNRPLPLSMCTSKLFVG